MNFFKKFIFFPHNQKWIKTVPTCIDGPRPSATLAYLICGDGTFTGFGILISADNFLIEERDLLMDSINSKLGFNCTGSIRDGKENF